MLNNLAGNGTRALITKLQGGDVGPASNWQVGTWINGDPFDGQTDELCVKLYGANSSDQRQYCTDPKSRTVSATDQRG